MNVVTLVQAKKEKFFVEKKKVKNAIHLKKNYERKQEDDESIKIKKEQHVSKGRFAVEASKSNHDFM